MIPLHCPRGVVGPQHALILSNCILSKKLPVGFPFSQCLFKIRLLHIVLLRVFQPPNPKHFNSSRISNISDTAKRKVVSHKTQSIKLGTNFTLRSPIKFALFLYIHFRTKQKQKGVHRSNLHEGRILSLLHTTIPKRQRLILSSTTSKFEDCSLLVSNQHPSTSDPKREKKKRIDRKIRSHEPQADISPRSR